MKSVALTEVLSTCVDACRRGCEVIRNVRHKNDFNGSVHYKVNGDSRSALTEADCASQKVIVECLTLCWATQMDTGQIKIIGEEDDENSTDIEIEQCDTPNSDDTGEVSESDVFEKYKIQRPDVEPIQKTMFDSVDLDQPGVLVTEKDEIIIFIDPMDGTREVSCCVV